MSKTNCVNCGASKEVSDLQCPFCGTKYADLTTFDLFHDHEMYIQLRGSDGAVRTAKAYITNTTFEMRPEIASFFADGRRVHSAVQSLNVSGSIDFTLYESM